MSKKKKAAVVKRKHIKASFKFLVFFLLLTFILGLIFMNFLFSLILVLGIILILWISRLFESKKKKKWVRILINSLAIIVLLVAIAGVGGVAWFLK